MGKQKKSSDVIKINTNRLSGKNGKKDTECAEELASFFSCMTRSSYNVDEKCSKERHALTACATAAARRPKVVNTINYHLQRISRMMK